MSSMPAPTLSAWGSFKTPPVDVLINQSDEEYTPPPNPLAHTALSLLQQHLTSPPDRPPSPPPPNLPPASFTSSILPSYPLPPSLTSSPLLHSALSLVPLSRSFTFINHGAFGCPLTPLTFLQSLWLAHLNAQPLRFFDRQLLPLLVLALRRLARWLHCSPASLSFVPNATTALTSVVHSIALHPSVWGVTPHSSSLLLLSVAYGAVKKQLKWLAAHLHLRLIELPVAFPYHPESVVTAVETALASASPPIAVAFFDHITSNTALLLPLPQLLVACSGVRVRTVVDGAHAPWQLPLDLSSLPSVTAYAGNLHKWACNPKGAAFLHCPDEGVRAALQPPAVSHGYGASFTSNFLWVGCNDYAALLTVMGTLDVWEQGWEVAGGGGEGGRRVGWEEARGYAAALCRWAAAMLAGVWGTTPLCDDGFGLCMRCVAVGWGDGVEGAGERLQDRLYAEYGLECPVKVVEGRLYVRISAHVYNRPEDYVHLAYAVQRIRQEAV